MRLTTTDIKLMGYKKIAFNYFNKEFMKKFDKIYEIFRLYKHDIRPYSLMRYRDVFEFIPRNQCSILVIADMIDTKDLVKAQRSFKQLWDTTWKNIDIASSEVGRSLKSDIFYNLEYVGIRQPYILNDLNHDHFKNTYKLSDEDKIVLIDVFNMFNDIFTWTYLCRCGAPIESQYILDTLILGDFTDFRKGISKLESTWSSLKDLKESE